MRSTIKLSLLCCAIAAGMADARAGATIQIDEQRSISVGFGARASYTSVEDGAPDRDSRSHDFDLDSARLYFGATLNKNIGGMFNTEWDGDRIRVLDAAAQFTFSPAFNVWAGRLLSPSDRANMAGPYYSLGGGYWAGVASRYGYNGGIFRGRDDGVVVWGNVLGGKLGYSVGAFEGRTYGIGSLTQDQARDAGVDAGDQPMVAGRVQVDFWDPEPGYYGTGTYLGSKDILAIGVAGRYQKEGVITLLDTGNYNAWNVDFLLEKRLAGGALSIEAAYYRYRNDGVILAEQGKAWSAGLGYIFNIGSGGGRLQPFAHYQRFEPDTRLDTRQADAGVNYIIDGYNAQLSAMVSRTKIASLPDQSKFAVALQVQY